MLRTIAVRVAQQFFFQIQNSALDAAFRFIKEESKFFISIFFLKE